MTEQPWSESAIKNILQENDFSYQNIKLPYSLSTGGQDRSPTARKIFPEDLEGKSVLDIGSKFGYFCFEALKRGAKRVVGLDVDPDCVRKARLLAACQGLEARASFQVLDIEYDDFSETFDYVLCLNVLHHLRNPLLAIDRLIPLTKEKLILEVAAFGVHDRKKMKVSYFKRRVLNESPVIYVSPSGASGKKAVQRFFISPSAIENLLLHQRGPFAKVDTIPSEHKGRYISIARKRKIQQLLVVSGPTSIGKSTFIKKLMKNELGEVSKSLEMEDPSAWVMSSPILIKKNLKDAFHQKMIFHYDFLRPYQRSARVPKRDDALEIVDTADHVVFLTLWCPSNMLRDRLKRGELDPNTVNGVYKGRERYLQLYEEYKDPQKIYGHYQNWFEFTSSKNGRHVMASLTDTLELFSLDEWESRMQAEIQAHHI